MARPSPAPRPFLEGPDLGAGFLAALPLFACYELGQALAGAGAVRSPAERLLGLVLVLAGENALAFRLGFLVLAALLAGWMRGQARAAGYEGPTLARQIAEGMGFGLALAPLLYGLLSWLHGLSFAVQPQAPPALPSVLRLAGAAPWEELLFRVGAYGLVFLVVGRGARFLGLPAALGFVLAELVALLGSSLAFAVFHLDAVQQHLGLAGEPYAHGIFLWRVSAGILLGALFRWRGFGVAAWAHAVFNLGIALTR